ncbi:MAG: 16S rRNA (adenine(1518)-N(6)/adenine(1519)-N(6))-dimethyltransferase RsmA, partial [candidate division WOR-3 bacterium]|nr:16S rRNA (adenine(1518)-N(6)/adenine(1519)-N(6))-dimethyltransferase RsmA [candidate division WOR-3 bacterium]
MTVKEIKRILGDKFLSKSRGQTLLLDENIARKIADLVDEMGEKRILEIGPGLGIITKFLKAKGYEVTTVEIDKDFCEYLRGKGIKVINEDFLKLSVNQSLPRAVVSALPFSVSVQILLRLKEKRKHFRKWFVVVQKEVAERIISKPCKKTYSSLSIIFQLLFDINIEFNIPPNAFFPKPGITSTVLKGSLKENPFIEVTPEFEKLLKDIFRFRRKTLKNNLF